MSRAEYVSLAGLRIDGRRPGEVRKISARMGLFGRVDGSAYYEQGNTKVIAVVYGPREASKRVKAHHDKAVVQCEVTMASFATTERRKKRAGDRKLAEMSLAVKQTFEQVIQSHLYKRSQIDMHVQILQSDGGELAACINATTLALVDAGIALQDFVVACDAGYLDRTPLLDLNFVEASGGGPTLPVAVLPRSEKIALVQMDSRLPLDVFEAVMKLAMEGCRHIYEILQSTSREHTLKRLHARGALMA